MKRSHQLAPCLVAMGLVLPVVADELDPMEILKKAEAAARAVTAVAYKAEFHAEGNLGAKAPRLTGTVRAQVLPNAAVPKLVLEAIAVEPNSREPAFYHLINDGMQFVNINRVQRRAWQGDPPKSVSELLRRMGTAAALWVHEFVHPLPFQAEFQADSLEYQGTQRVNGVECDVIRVVYGKGASDETRWYIGREDHLPRRKDRVAPGGALALTLAELDTRPAFAADTFAIKVPNGYQVKWVSLLPVGWPAPEWTLKTPEGQSVSLESLRGRVVVLDFWATWCTPCVVAMSDVQKLHERYRDKPVSVFGINVKERRDPAAYMREHGYTYGLLLKGEEVAQAYRAQGIPILYVIGPDGKIVFRSRGFDGEARAKVDEVISKALAENEQAAPAPERGERGPR